MNPLRLTFVYLHLAAALCWGQGAFVNFETAPVNPIALSPGGSRLAVCNLADGKLELFDVTSGNLVTLGSVPVGIDPVAVRFRNATEAWVVNHISDSISVVDIASMNVKATIQTLDTPADVVFAGARAFVSCAMPNSVQVFDANSRQFVTNINIEAERPKALAVSPDGTRVYAAIFESGNATTIIGPRFRNLLFIDNPVSNTNGPYGGLNPPPNSGANFEPPLNPALGTNVPPKTGLIVRKNPSGRWLDDNEHDWTEFVSGTNAHLTQRAPGWDLPDRDLAIIATADFSVSYATGLMNVCMAVGVNPASGQVAVVGTDAKNELRFEPNLNGVFLKVQVALVGSSGTIIKDLNPSLIAANREQAIGDPRAIVWTANGTRAYVAGMGSRNVLSIDADGNRIPALPIEVGEGPCGLALDVPRQRLYVFNRFSSSVSVIDIGTETVLNAVPLFDPTPINVSAGRRHLYDTRHTSGFGQASCASCHVDGRMDRLAWDLGNPAGEMLSAVVNHQGTFVTNNFHPMKGVMVTQTLQDIIGHEPFHWRGDRPDIESFNGTFTNLQGAARGLTPKEMRELRDLLASMRFPPNPYRQLDNSFATNMLLPGHLAVGEDMLPAGALLPNGNAATGLALFNLQGNFCFTCHTLPSGLGADLGPVGPNGGHHLPLAFRLEDSLRSKISQFRNMADKVGMHAMRSGFGFGHDGSIDSLARFLSGVRIVRDQDIADLIAFLLSGSDSPPAAVGRQITVTQGRPAMFDAMLALAGSPTSGVELIAKGHGRGWFCQPGGEIFQSDKAGEIATVEQLIGLGEITFTLAPRGLGVRMGIDRDLDGIYDGDDSSPADLSPKVRIVSDSTEVPVGSDLLLEAQLAAMPSAVTGIVWRQDGVLQGTNASLTVNQTGDYQVTVTTAFQTYTSPPVRVTAVPLIVGVTPAAQSARLGAAATFTAAKIGLDPVQYQWRFHETNLPGATATSLTISNAQLTHEGLYRVVASNPHGSVTSAPVRLGLLINPAVVVPPLNQRVAVGGDATFSFAISGHPPPFGYLLRRSSTVLTSYTTDETLGFLSLFNVQLSNAATYRIVITNAANPSPGLTLDPVTLTVLADSDGDGLSDEWEAQYATDPNSDADLDGQSNWQEYVAGTNPLDPQSFLRISLSDPQVIQFRAASNKTYTVQWRGSLDTQPWIKLADIVAVPTNRLVTITNAIQGGVSRFYRLATPRTP